MTPFIVLAITPIFMRIAFPKFEKNKTQESWYLFFCGLIMLVVMGCRSKYLGSADTYNYCRNMLKAVNATDWEHYYNNWRGAVETGYQIFVWLFTRVFHHEQWLLVATSLFFIISISLFIKKYSDIDSISLVLYITIALMLFNLQGMRQSIAMGICIFAFDAANERKLLKFVALVLLAASFHRTAVVFLVVYIIPWLKYSLRTIILTVIGAIIVLVSSNYIINIANNIFTITISRIYTHVAEYGGYVVLVIHLLIIIVTILFNREIKKNTTETQLLFIAIIGCVCYCMRYLGAREAERIGFYFSFAEIALLPNAIKYVSAKSQLIMRVSIVLLAIMLFIYKLKISEFIPYQFFWQVDYY